MLPLLFGCLYALGMVSLLRKKRWLAVFLLAPVVTTFAASAVHLYPFQGRLMLFLCPLTILGMSAAAEWDERNAAFGLTPIGLLSAFTIAASLINTVIYKSFLLPGRMESDRAFEYVFSHAAPGDLVYVYPGLSETMQFEINFSRKYDLSKVHFAVGHPSDFPRFVNAQKEVRGYAHVWVVTASASTTVQDVQGPSLEATLNLEGRLQREWTWANASLWLYDMSGPSSQPSTDGIDHN